METRGNPLIVSGATRLWGRGRRASPCARL